MTVLDKLIKKSVLKIEMGKILPGLPSEGNRDHVPISRKKARREAPLGVVA